VRLVHKNGSRRLSPLPAVWHFPPELSPKKLNPKRACKPTRRLDNRVNDQQSSVWRPAKQVALNITVEIELGVRLHREKVHLDIGSLDVDNRA
jgi:hypothetical protein